MRIGLIDSGAGGLAFLNGIKKQNNSYVLIMDKAFFPYGDKSVEFLIKRSIYLVDYLFNVKKVDKVILACNTLSLIVLDFLKLLYSNISGVIELIPKVQNSIFIGTKNSCNYYEGESFCASELIYKIENNLEYKEDIYKICKQFNKYDWLILGCTHFIKVKEEFRKYKKIISQDEMYLKRCEDV